MTFHSGRKGTAKVGGTEVPTLSWRVNAPAQIVEFKNSKTGRVPARESSFLDLSGTVVLDYDFDQSPFGLGIVSGGAISNLVLLPNGASSAADGWTVPDAIVTSTPHEVVVDGKIGLSFDWVVNNKNGATGSGGWTGPSGYTPSSVTPA